MTCVSSSSEVICLMTSSFCKVYRLAGSWLERVIHLEVSKLKDKGGTFAGERGSLDENANLCLFIIFCTLRLSSSFVV